MDGMDAAPIDLSKQFEPEICIHVVGCTHMDIMMAAANKQLDLL